jgi:hemolysin type calcium-binding protein
MRSPFRLVTPLITALALLLPAAAADAGTAHVGPAPNYEGGFAVYYVAAAGERNDVTVSVVYDSMKPFVSVHDAAVAVEPGEGCARVDDHTARCTGDPIYLGITVIEARLGDENDEFHKSESVGYSAKVRSFGGRGDDLLVGGAGRDDQLDGGGGRDVILGGPGDEMISDGDLPGATGESRPGPDVLDGGGGRNLIDYSRRTAPIILDLGRSAKGGERNEDDTIRNFDHAAGGSGDDRLTGSTANNSLTGNGGDDMLVGLAGQDRLYGGAGRDRLTGGAGSDFFFPDDFFDSDRGIDSFSCGSGRDTVWFPAPGELIGACEFITFNGPTIPGKDASSYLTFAPHPAATSRAVVSFSIPCPKFDFDVPPRPCAGKLTLRAHGGGHALLGRARKTDKESSWVRVRLTSAGRRLIRRKNGVVATMSLRGAPSAGDPFPNVAWTVRLRL